MFCDVFCLSSLRVVIVVVRGVFVESEEAASFVCLQVVGAGWFVGVYCVHWCFLFRFIIALFWFRYVDFKFHLVSHHVSFSLSRPPRLKRRRSPRSLWSFIMHPS